MNSLYDFYDPNNPLNTGKDDGMINNPGYIPMDQRHTNPYEDEYDQHPYPTSLAQSPFAPADTDFTQESKLLRYRPATPSSDMEQDTTKEKEHTEEQGQDITMEQMVKEAASWTEDVSTDLENDPEWKRLSDSFMVPQATVQDAQDTPTTDVDEDMREVSLIASPEHTEAEKDLSSPDSSIVSTPSPTICGMEPEVNTELKVEKESDAPRGPKGRKHWAQQRPVLHDKTEASIHRTPRRRERLHQVSREERHYSPPRTNNYRGKRGYRQSKPYDSVRERDSEDRRDTRPSQRGRGKQGETEPRTLEERLTAPSSIHQPARHVTMGITESKDEQPTRAAVTQSELPGSSRRLEERLGDPNSSLLQRMCKDPDRTEGSSNDEPMVSKAVAESFRDRAVRDPYFDTVWPTWGRDQFPPEYGSLLTHLNQALMAFPQRGLALQNGLPTVESEFAVNRKFSRAIRVYLDSGTAQAWLIMVLQSNPALTSDDLLIECLRRGIPVFLDWSDHHRSSFIYDNSSIQSAPVSYKSDYEMLSMEQLRDASPEEVCEQYLKRVRILISEHDEVFRVVFYGGILWRLLSEWSTYWTPLQTNMINRALGGPSRRYRTEYVHLQGRYPMSDTELHAEAKNDPLSDLLCGKHSTRSSDGRTTETRYLFPPVHIWNRARFREEIWSRDAEGWISPKIRAVKDLRGPGRTAAQWFKELRKMRDAEKTDWNRRPDLRQSVTDWRALHGNLLAGTPLETNGMLNMAKS